MWPSQIKCGVCITFDLDAEFVSEEDPGFINKPGARSQGSYGPKIGVPLILNLLERHDTEATFSSPE